MKKFKSIIRKKGILKTIIYTCLVFVMLTPIIVLKKPIVASFRGTCVASTFEQLEKCQEQGRYTKIKTKNIYDVGYNYVVDGKTVGKFLDIDLVDADLKSHIIIALVDTAAADELLNREGEREISGQFVSFEEKVYSETLNKVKKEYIERFTEEEIITEEQTNDMFFGYMLNQYDGRGFPYVIPVIMVGIMVILLIFKVAEGLKMSFAPERYIVYGKKTLARDENANKASFEYQNGPFLFENKHIKITNNYIFNTKGYNFVYHKINEAVWMYEEGIKRYGLFETGKYLIIKFKDRVSLALTLNLKDRKKVMEILRVKNPNIVKGYDQKIEEKYRKNPEDLK